jgi:hypothetical protein
MTTPQREPSILVFASGAIADQLPEAPEGVLIVHFKTIDGLCQLMAKGASAFVLVSDSIADAELPRVARAVHESGTPCIELRSAPWDGTTFSPLSAACRGVISGFGFDAMSQAVEVSR